MNINKKITLISVLLLFAAFAITVIAQETKPALGENRLIYTVKYVEGRDLAKLLDDYIDKSQGMSVNYNEGLKTIIITAPKETHPILMALIEKFDKEPSKVELNVYMVLKSSKESTEFKNIEREANPDDDFQKKLEILNSMDTRYKYYGLGKFYLPLISSKTIYNTTWTFMTKIGNLSKVKLSTRSIGFNDQAIQIYALSVMFTDSKGKEDFLMMNSFDIGLNSMDKLILFNGKEATGLNIPASIELLFWPRIIKK